MKLVVAQVMGEEEEEEEEKKATSLFNTCQIVFRSEKRGFMGKLRVAKK